MIGFPFLLFFLWWLIAKRPYRRRVRYTFRQSGFVVELDRWTNRASSRKTDIFGN